MGTRKLLDCAPTRFHQFFFEDSATVSSADVNDTIEVGQGSQHEDRISSWEMSRLSKDTLRQLLGEAPVTIYCLFPPRQTKMFTLSSVLAVLICRKYHKDNSRLL